MDVEVKDSVWVGMEEKCGLVTLLKPRRALKLQKKGDFNSWRMDGMGKEIEQVAWVRPVKQVIQIMIDSQGKSMKEITPARNKSELRLD